MKLANIDVLVWLIIFVMISLAKGWSKLQRSIDDDSSKSEEAPSVARPKPQRSPPPRLQPRPAAAPMLRTARPPQRGVPSAVPPRVPASMAREWKVSADDIRQFVEQLGGKLQPRLPPPPVAPPPIRKVEPPPPPPKAEPATGAPVATQTVVGAPAPAQTSRASQWMEALRDRQNIRNIIISAEIIGPPKAESV